ncbi:thioredoxin [Rhizocola hellebori]|uniref:Thioredoxin n=1 Tax=Rhizocola hellebori TaxID=1392758 RepID=A0A8J3Q7H8_9ACTN|nr:hypothetical protein [Rhizocola hellebori]GIH04864.1 thioredoxin [Rhizocola hellebori]
MAERAVIPAAPDIRETGRRVEQLLDSLASTAEPQLRMHAEELVGLLVELYGEGLNRIVSIVGEQSPAEAARITGLMISDELVSGLLVLHGLHPLDLRTRVQAVLDRVVPSLAQPAPKVELLAVSDAGAVRLRWTAAASGCGSGGCGSGGSGDRQRLEEAILDAVADVTAVEVEQIESPKAPTLIPVESLFRDRASVVNR